MSSPETAPAPAPSGPNLKRDAVSGFLVFLIALPLCLGIAMASGYPPVAGVLTAIVGGVLVSLLGSAKLTIKGPAAGLIVIALGAATELGEGDPAVGYPKALAVGVVAGAIQVIFALTRAGVLADLMPPSVVHGMLAAIGVIIISKQTHTLVGVSPHAKEPLELLREIPASLGHANAVVALIGLASLAILITLPRLPFAWAKRVPAPMLVLGAAVPAAVLLDFKHAHALALGGHEYELGPRALVTLPGSLLSAIRFPDFSSIGSAVSVKYVVMFSLVGSIESLLSVSAVDSLDPAKHASDANRDLLATGIGNVVASSIGGLPMISEIVRSKANIDAGATSRWSNFFHGLYLLLFVALVPGLLGQIPLAALAAMLIFTGFRLASPREFAHVYKLGKDQFFLFVTTCVVTLATDLLVGVGVGVALKLVLHALRGIPVGRMFRADLALEQDGEVARLRVHGSALFSNLLGLRRAIAVPPAGVKRMIIDFSEASVVDHTTLQKIKRIADEWPETELEIEGLGGHRRLGSDDTSVHVRQRAGTTSAGEAPQNGGSER